MAALAKVKLCDSRMCRWPSASSIGQPYSIPDRPRSVHAGLQHRGGGADCGMQRDCWRWPCHRIAGSGRPDVRVLDGVQTIAGRLDEAAHMPELRCQAKRSILQAALSMSKVRHQALQRSSHGELHRVGDRIRSGNADCRRIDEGRLVYWLVIRASFATPSCTGRRDSLGSAMSIPEAPH